MTDFHRVDRVIQRLVSVGRSTYAFRAGVERIDPQTGVDPGIRSAESDESDAFAVLSKRHNLLQHNVFRPRAASGT